jgi:hypothetical protein
MEVPPSTPFTIIVAPGLLFPKFVPNTCTKPGVSNAWLMLLNRRRREAEDTEDEGTEGNLRCQY